MTNMDLKDRKIIVELDKNARQNFSQIAKSVGLSKQVVRARVQNLEKNIIEGYYPIINFPLLGYSLHVVYLKFAGMPKEKEKKLIDRINVAKRVGLNVTVFGDWNLNLAIWAKYPLDFENTLNDIVKGFEQYIIKKTIMMESEANYFRFKLFRDVKNDAETIITKDVKERKEIDGSDELILACLSKNAREDIVKIAERLKMTPAAAAKRIKNLESKKIIMGYKPQLNLNLLHTKVFLHLQKITEEKEKQVMDYLSRIPEIISVSKTFGDYELEFRAQVENISDLHKIIEDFREKYPQEFIDFNLLIFIKFHRVLSYFPF